ncbi:hypothetical protein EI94DRAFT_1702658 [Lactarius quietus]|nr:hypothetical protein EI94DRAFT_1702658 [Lactarius quietus]
MAQIVIALPLIYVLCTKVLPYCLVAIKGPAAPMPPAKPTAPVALCPPATPAITEAPLLSWVTPIGFCFNERLRDVNGIQLQGMRYGKRRGRLHFAPNVQVTQAEWWKRCCLFANCTDILIAFPLYLMPPKAASELTQVEAQFLAIAARLFTAAMTFLAQPPDDGQQAYLVRKVKDEIISVGNQFKKFMGHPSKHTKKPRMHPIIQIMSEEWKVAEAEKCMPEWGIFTLDHISGYCHAQQEAHSDWHPDLSTLDLSCYLQGLQSHSMVHHFAVAMEVMAAPTQPSAPVSAASPTMPDAPSTSKAKAHVLPPAGSSDPYGALPALNMPPEAPYVFRRARRQPGAEPMQGTFSMTPSDDFEDCTSSDMIADMDKWGSQAAGLDGDARETLMKYEEWHQRKNCVLRARDEDYVLRERVVTASNTSLPCVQVDDASPPPPAQCCHLDIQPLIATGDYRCGTCKNPKVNNAQCVSQLNENHLTYKCAFCAEKRRLCAPAASWAQPIIHLIKFRNGNMIHFSWVSFLATFQDIPSCQHLVDQLPPAITPYHPLELPLHPWGFRTQHQNPSHVPVPNQTGQCIVGKAARHPPCTSKAEALAARVARHLSINEISCMYIINNVVSRPPRWIKGQVMCLGVSYV